MHNKKFRLYKSLLIWLNPYENISIDFMSTCLSEWQGKDVILMVVDRFIKLTNFGWTKTIVITIKITKLLFDLWV